MRVLGVDLGARRIGLAISDAEGSIAFPAGFIERHGLSRDLSALRALAVDRGVERVVVGLPLHMDGRVGPEARSAKRFARALEETLGVPVDLLDERWTTREAERALRAAEPRSSRRRRAGAVDSVAAAIVLRTYLERRAWRLTQEQAT